MSSTTFRRIRRAGAVALFGVGAMLMPNATAAVAQSTVSSTLSVWIDGWGAGTVTSSPAGINCHLGPALLNPYESDETQTVSGSCSASFPIGTVVTVTATADPGSTVNSVDCLESYGNPCAKTIEAGYNPAWVMFCPQDGLCSA